MDDELVSAVKRTMYAVETNVGGFGVKPIGDAQITDAEVEAIARAIIPLVLEHAAKALHAVVVAQGKPECCGFGVGGYESPPECCGNPDYMVSANAVAAAIRGAA